MAINRRTQTSTVSLAVLLCSCVLCSCVDLDRPDSHREDAQGGTPVDARVADSQGPNDRWSDGNAEVPDTIAPASEGGVMDVAPVADAAGRDMGVSDATIDQAPGPILMGLALYWKFDEAAGDMAMDSSGNSLNGRYTGQSGFPASSAQVPPTMFPNPSSRAFVLTNRHAVTLANMPSLLKPTNDLTITAWFRATTVDSGGADVVSGGNQYALQVRTDMVRFHKRVAGSSYAFCSTTRSGHLDGKWHHIAGLTNAQGSKLYLDGMEICTNTRGDAIQYDLGKDLWVGRHGDSGDMWDFGGNIDDVRVYVRALSAKEIMTLASGGG